MRKPVVKQRFFRSPEERKMPLSEFRLLDLTVRAERCRVYVCALLLCV